MEIGHEAFGLDFCTQQLIPFIQQIADRYLEIPYDINRKSHGNFVTTADRGIEKDLIAGLRRMIPEAGFIAEESGEDTKKEYNWIIDPIDGTTNFIYGLSYTVSVALSHREIDNVILGVVYSPKDQVLYYGCKGQGSYVAERNKRRRLQVRPFPADEGLAIFGMPYDRKKTDRIFELARKYYAISSDLKRIGPSSLDICRVAAGTAKVYFELDLKVWDIMAGILILTEAGGTYRIEGDLYIFGSGEVMKL